MLGLLTVGFIATDESALGDYSRATLKVVVRGETKASKSCEDGRGQVMDESRGENTFDGNLEGNGGRELQSEVYR